MNEELDKLEHVDMDDASEEVKALIGKLEELKGQAEVLEQAASAVRQTEELLEKAESEAGTVKKEAAFTVGQAHDILSVLNVIADQQRANLGLDPLICGKELSEEASSILMEINKAHRSLLKMVNKNS
jgi:CRISPR/Cas system-associated endonuclease Cas3-HD